MGDKVEVPTIALAQVIERLTDRRIAVEKAVNSLGEAPSGLRDVFELCRGFERGFATIINDSPSASKIKEAFFSDKGLAGMVAKLPLERVFELESVKKICRTADGYQPHLVSPEKGLRLMAAKALDQVEGPVHSCVSNVYNLLVDSAREAAAMAGENTEAALSGKVPLNVPEFKTVIMPAIIRALDEWRQEAEKMADMMVDMERSYITAGFFRYTMHRRFERQKQQEVLEKALTKARMKGKKLDNNNTGELDAHLDEAEGKKGFFNKQLSVNRAPEPAGNSVVNLAAFGDPNDFIAAYFDKKVNEDSARQSLPVQTWRWQKRFFIFSDSQRSIYYFKSPDDVSKSGGVRGTIFLGDTVVEDLDSAGNPRPSFGSAEVEMQRGDKASLLLRVRAKDVRRPIVKDHVALVLRAENVSVKYEWLARMAAASRGGPPVPMPQAPQQPPAGTRRDSAEQQASPSANGAAAAAGATAPAQLEAAPSVVSSNGEYLDPVLSQASRRDEFDEVQSTRLGQGAKFFRADDLRDDHGRLLPAAGIVLGPVAQASAGGNRRAVSMQETWEGRYEALVEQFAQDMSIYIRMICDTIVTTVPKSVVHCLVRKAEKNLLNQMFGHVHKLSEEELKRMLQEDDSVTRRRAQVRALYDKVKMAIDDVQYMQEKIKRKEEDKETVAISAEVLALAAMTELLSGDQRRAHADLIKSPYMPELRPPVPLSHLARPKTLPAAPQGLLQSQSSVASSVASQPAGLARTSVGPGGAVPRRAAPPGPPDGRRVSGGGSMANGMPAAPPARRAPPPPPPK